jgi:hypothetical protein
VAIPYKTAIDPAPATLNPVFGALPTAKVSIIGEALNASKSFVAVPEDQVGGIQFTVDLGKATLLGSGTLTHLVKVYGIPDNAKLSTGAQVDVSSTNPESFWVLTQEQIANPLAIIGLPTNYLAPIALKAQAVASAVVGTAVQTVIGDAQAIASTATIIGVADTPLLTPSVSGITGLEGGEVFVSANGQAAGSQTLTLTKGTLVGGGPAIKGNSVALNLLEAGNSIDVPFDEVYVFATPSGPTPEAVHQMVGRVREVRSSARLAGGASLLAAVLQRRLRLRARARGQRARLLHD